MIESPSQLAMTEEESQELGSSFTVKLLGHRYNISDIEDILWDNGEGDYCSGKDYPNNGHEGYTDAETLWIILVDGTELEVDILDLDFETQDRLYEWIDTM